MASYPGRDAREAVQVLQGTRQDKRASGSELISFEGFPEYRHVISPSHKESLPIFCELILTP